MEFKEDYGGYRRQKTLAIVSYSLVDIVSAGAYAGYLPPELTAEALAERIDLAPLWTAQEQAVGIA
jgi:hypothetical protein